MATATAKAASDTAPVPPPLPASHHPSRAVQLTGMHRDAAAMIGESLPMMVPAPSFVQVGSKSISTSKKCRAWKWDPFTTSARSDGQKFSHWVRAGVEYPDYPYARFDIHLEPVTYTDEEYATHLQNPQWTKSDTDALMIICRVHELRWPVIYDAWLGRFGSTNSRKIQDLQHRYYSVAATLVQVRITKEAALQVAALAAISPETTESVLETAAARALATADPNHQPLMSFPQTGTSNKCGNGSGFDLARETERRQYLEILWNRGKKEEEEEDQLRKELKLIEAQLRKLKKNGGHIRRANTAAQQPQRAMSPVPAPVLDQAFSSTAPTPMPETPYLQSGRLVPPATGGASGINKLTLKRMDTILVDELGVNPKPLPTKRICDLYDTVRKNAITLMTLQKIVLQKEGQLQTKRLRLAKLGGSSGAMSEEALLGITPVPPPVSARATTSATHSKKSSSHAKAATTTLPSTTTQSSSSQLAQRGASTGKKVMKSPAGSKKATTGAKKRKSKADTATTAAPAAASAFPNAPAAASVAATPAPAVASPEVPKKRAKKTA